MKFFLRNFFWGQLPLWGSPLPLRGSTLPLQGSTLPQGQTVCPAAPVGHGLTVLPCRAAQSAQALPRGRPIGRAAPSGQAVLPLRGRPIGRAATLLLTPLRSS